MLVVPVRVQPVKSPVSKPPFTMGLVPGAVTVSETVGSYSAATGSAVATTGDSSVSQSFVAGANGTLSFWYAISCPDAVTYDWGTVTLRDNTVGTTTAVLPRTCPGPGNYVWQQRTSPVVAGHSYTLTFMSHDDGYSSDPTYAVWDDVVVL